MHNYYQLASFQIFITDCDSQWKADTFIFHTTLSSGSHRFKLLNLIPKTGVLF